MLLALFVLLSLGGTLGILLGADAFSSLQWLWMLPVGLVGSILGALVLVLGPCIVAILVIDVRKPQEHDSKFYRWLSEELILFLRTLLRMRIHVEGFEKVPPQGRFVLVCNHRHDSDPAFLLSVLKGRQLAFIAKKEVADMFAVGKLLHKLSGQFINRENDKEALKTILRCIRLLKEDQASVAVFPEGYVYESRTLHHFRHGVFKIATKAKVPLVVCTMRGTREVFHNILHFKATDIHIRFLATITEEEYRDITTVELSERVYAMMAADLEPDGLVYHGEEAEN